MLITKEFLVAEITRLEAQRVQASNFVTAVSGAIDGMKSLVERIDAPEPEPAQPENPTCPSPL
jgi:hypothetical protein